MKNCRDGQHGANCRCTEIELKQQIAELLRVINGDESTEDDQWGLYQIQYMQRTENQRTRGIFLLREVLTEFGEKGARYANHELLGRIQKFLEGK